MAPLSGDEERALTALVARGREAQRRLDAATLTPAQVRHLRREHEEGLRAESTLLRATIGLVRARVVERGYRFGDEDVEAAGVEGLANALRRFDPDKGARFSTYANYWITKLVNQAIRQQVGFSEAEMDLVLKLQKLLRSDLNKNFTTREIATALGVSTTKARDIVQLNRELVERRYGPTGLGGDEVHPSSDVDEAPHWVIESLKRLCGADFDDFWQHTFRTMSIEELARGRGISRQAMSKRLERCRRAVRESPEAQRLQEWFERQ